MALAAQTVPPISASVYTYPPPRAENFKMTITLPVEALRPEEV